MDDKEWDARYAEADGPLFGAEPAVSLRAALGRPDVRPADALALADGDGRNGRWLAGMGVAVTAVDFSTEATRRAEATDAATGRRVARIVADLRRWAPPDGRRWGLVVLIGLHGPADLRLGALRLAAAAVAPGGWLLVEGFAAGEGAEVGPGPRDPSRRWRADEIEPALGGFVVHELLSGRVLLREGPRHDGEAHMLRLLARALPA